ncbi:MAG: ParB N-terminal domain-containing protein [Chthoniobacter sp.]|nr:ParB N-terminal domain-containing protein [Chthoniobacter sp.]
MKINFKESPRFRIHLDPEVIDAFATKMREGEKFPFVILMNDGEQYLIADGWHRLLAARKNGYQRFPALCFGGTKQDALALMFRLHSLHGVPLARADRDHAVVLACESFPEKANFEIAAMCGEPIETVATLREANKSGLTKPKPKKDGGRNDAGRKNGKREATAETARKEVA